MYDNTVDFLMQLDFTSYMGIGLYWIPAVLCLIAYTVRSWKEYQKDLKSREKSGYYRPTLTIGSILAKLFASLMPGLNILSLVFHVGAGMISTVGEFFSKLLDIPLVRPKKN